MYKVGEYYRQAGDLSKALRYYRRAVKLKPTHAKFRQTLEQTLKLSKP